jgi:hypothetical protein
VFSLAEGGRWISRRRVFGLREWRLHIVKIQLLIACAALAIGASALAQNQAGVQGGASTGAQTSASASESGASATGSSAASAHAGTKRADANLAGGTELNATLVKPVDASKNKPGDAVTATNAQDVKSGGQVVIPKGSKLIGRVTQAQPRTKGGSSGGGSADGKSESQLGFVFERAVLKDGREIPLNATVQAVAATAASARSSGSGLMTTGGGSGTGSGGATGGGLVSTAGGAATGTVGTVAGAGGTVSSNVGGAISRSAGATGGLNAAGRLTSGSKGVFGLKGLDISSSAAGSGDGSLITSATRNVRLESGTNMLLVAGASAAGSTGSAANAGNSKGGESAQEPPDRDDRR